MKTPHKICFTTNQGYLFLAPTEISYIKSEDIYTYIHNGTEKHFSTQSLKQLIEILPDQHYVRCHRSYIVNTTKVFRLIKSDNYKLIMENGDEVPVARSRKKEVLQKLLTHQN